MVISFTLYKLFIPNLRSKYLFCTYMVFSAIAPGVHIVPSTRDHAWFFLSIILISGLFAPSLRHFSSCLRRWSWTEYSVLKQAISFQWFSRASQVSYYSEKKTVMRLIVRYYHESKGHQMGVKFIINRLREKCLVLQVRQAVKRPNKTTKRNLAPLLLIHLERISWPVDYCAADLEASLTTQWRGRSWAKRSLCLLFVLKQIVFI